MCFEIAKQSMSHSPHIKIYIKTSDSHLELADVAGRTGLLYLDEPVRVPFAGILVIEIENQVTTQDRIYVTQYDVETKLLSWVGQVL